ncbi:Uncharacterised protein [Mycobacteroides abscessus subsp. abscessus]|nr:Uncharacterised protein [Mycobacteroides abscessus subsp. abscessus]
MCLAHHRQDRGDADPAGNEETPCCGGEVEGVARSPNPQLITSSQQVHLRRAEPAGYAPHRDSIGGGVGGIAGERVVALTVGRGEHVDVGAGTPGGQSRAVRSGEGDQAHPVDGLDTLDHVESHVESDATHRVRPRKAFGEPRLREDARIAPRQPVDLTQDRRRIVDVGRGRRKVVHCSAARAAGEIAR